MGYAEEQLQCCCGRVRALRGCARQRVIARPPVVGWSILRACSAMRPAAEAAATSIPRAVVTYGCRPQTRNSFLRLLSCHSHSVGSYQESHRAAPENHLRGRHLHEVPS